MPRDRTRPRARSAAAPPAPTASALSDGRLGEVQRRRRWSTSWPKAGARATRARSALGVAGMMAMLAAAANGQTRGARAASRARRVRGAGAAERRRLEPRRGALDAQAAAHRPLARDAAEVILSGLSFSHRAGTARLACEQVFDARTLRARSDWIAGKTGTPTFPNDDRSLDELARLCAPRHAPPPATRPRRLRPAAAVQVVRRRVSRRSGNDAALDQGDRRADRAQLAGRRPGASTAPAITAPIRRPRSRCRSPAASWACWRRHDAIARAELTASQASPRARPATTVGGAARLDLRRPVRDAASPTSRTRCGAPSCRSATCRRSRC